MTITPQEIARCLRRDLGTVRKAIAYARRVETSGGAYSADYGEAADYLEKMYPAAIEPITINATRGNGPLA